MKFKPTHYSTTELLKKLIAFQTVSSQSNLELIDFIQDYLSSFGIAAARVQNSEKTKSNLYATIGPKNIRGVMLSGHTDVVPVEGQNWSKDPFDMWEDNDALFGRGTADMKGFIACVLAAIPALVSRPLKQPLHLAFSYDEEVGCLGVRDMIAVFAKHKLRPSLCIIGEPTMMEVATCHKGKCAYRVICAGKEIHSGYAPMGLNAIHLATELIADIRHIQSELQTKSGHNDKYDIPYSTLHVGIINGGTALNIVPNMCTFDFELRNLSSDNQRKIIQTIKDKADTITRRYKTDFPDCDISFEKLADYPGLDTPAEAEAVTFVKSLAQTNNHGAINFGTEGGLFQEALDIPVIICGPGSIKVAHKPDEYIQRAQLKVCDEFMARLTAYLHA